MIVATHVLLIIVFDCLIFVIALNIVVKQRFVRMTPYIRCHICLGKTNYTCCALAVRGGKRPNAVSTLMGFDGTDDSGFILKAGFFGAPSRRPPILGLICLRSFLEVLEVASFQGFTDAVIKGLRNF